MIRKNKRHLCLCAAAFVWGILLHESPPGVRVLLGAAAALSCIFLLKTCGRKGAGSLLVLLAVPALGAFLLCARQTDQYQKIIGQVACGGRIRVAGTVCRKEVRSDKYLYYLKKTSCKNENGTFRGGRILLYADDGDLAVGSVIIAEGTARTFDHAPNEGGFDAADYYRFANITFRVSADRAKAAAVPRLQPGEGLYRLQQRISGVFAGELNERDAGILCMMVVGNRSYLEDDVRRMYQEAGISHILAISGLHISVLGLGIYRFFRRVWGPYLPSAAVSSAVVCLFALMSGFGVSARRAMIMYLFLMGADVLGRVYDPANALAAAALLILIQNPLALYQSGFLFSFAALLAIILFGGLRAGAGDRRECGSDAKERGEGSAGIKRKAETSGDVRGEGSAAGKRESGSAVAGKPGIRARVGNALLMNGALQMFLMPLTAWFYYEIPVYALFLNLLLLPLCSWLLGFGIFGGLAGLLFPTLSKWLLVVCHGILTLYETAIGAVRLIPGNNLITGRPPAWTIVACYLIWAALLWYLYRKERTSRAACRGRGIRCALLMLLPVAFLFFGGKEEFRIDFLDVGQGDGICISDGAGRHIFVDGGSSSEADVGTDRIEPFLKYNRIRRIDAWIVTHGDEDHISGLIELLKPGYPVETLMIAEAMPDGEARRELAACARRAGTEIVYVKARDRIALSGAELRCLYPEREEAAADANALSQVWLLERGEFSLLLTGDIGEEQERLLLERGSVGKVTVLKAAHHGSKYASSKRFLAQAAPELTVISCGESNRYGHPHPDTVARLREAKSRILLTWETGQISLRERRGRVCVEFPCSEAELTQREAGSAALSRFKAR